MKDNLNTGRKFLNDRVLPNKEQISNYKNFDQVYKDYSLVKKLLFKKIILWTSAIIGTAGLATALYFNKSFTDVEQDNSFFTTTEIKMNFIEEPLLENKIPFSIFLVNAKAGAEIVHNNSTYITVPSNAFRFPNGEIVEDSVEIHYREFLNPLDIFLSGIPMTYDSGGTKFTFESAGMIEIIAFARNQQLIFNDESPVIIDIPSKNGDSRFNDYYLDTVNKNWVYTGKSEVINLNEIQKKSESHDFTSTFQQENSNLNEPLLASPQKYNFKIAYSKTDFPELVAYENVLFEVTDNTFKPDYYKTHWDNIELVNGISKGTFIVNLVKADTTISVNVVPVFEEANYQNALDQFQKKHKKSSTKTTLNKIEKEHQLEKVNQNLRTYNSKEKDDILIRSRNNAGSYNPTVQNNRSLNANTDIPFRRIIRTRSNRTMYNQDFGMSTGPARPIAPVNDLVSLTDIKTNSSPKIYLVEKGKNALFTFSGNDTVKFDPSIEHLIWTVTENAGFAFFNYTNPATVASSKGNIPYTLIKSQEEGLATIREFLK